MTYVDNPIVSTRPQYVLRPPDWRWQRASYMVTHPEYRYLNDDEGVDLACDIFGALERCENLHRICEISRAFPDEFETWELYKQHRGVTQKAEIEARMMANEHLESIGRKTQRSVEFLALYARLFFDVQDRLGAPSTVQTAVLPRQMREGFKPTDFDGLWKITGYWCGPLVLDHVVWPMASTESLQAATLFYDEQFRAQVSRKSLQAMQCMKITYDMQIPIMDAMMRVRELEKDEDRGNAQQSQMTNNMGIFFNNMPWQKAYTHEQLAKTNRLAQMDQGAVGMRAYELDNAAASSDFSNQLAAIMASAETVPFGNN